MSPGASLVRKERGCVSVVSERTLTADYPKKWEIKCLVVYDLSVCHNKPLSFTQLQGCINQGIICLYFADNNQTVQHFIIIAGKCNLKDNAEFYS